MSTTEAPAKADTVTVEIDGHPVECAKGSMIIEAADKIGVTIPRFCYHRKLSIAANCRMCLVDVEKAPKPLPACATPVMDGMKVYTESRRAHSAQANVMEFLLINHPLDCPICDQGGECELQDVAMGYGRSQSRFEERKRVVKDEDLGPLIATEMTRCIHCTRCVRFLSEISGTDELGGMGRGEATKISTFIGRSIGSELSGNIIDLCPVGALTNKPFRFRARPWELRSVDSVAPHDPVGSNIHYHTRRGKILRAVPRLNESINENWLSDRDRWGFEGLYSDERAMSPMIRNDAGELVEVEWEQALTQAADILKGQAPEQTGFLLSPRATNEELYLATTLARGIGCNNIDHRIRELDLSVASAPSFGMPLAAIDKADVILLVGGDVRRELPILGHRIRQAQLRGAKVHVLDGADHDLHFETASHELVRPSEWAATLADSNFARTAVEDLDGAERGAIILGNGAVSGFHAAAVIEAASQIAEKTGSSVCRVPAGANSRGAWLTGALPGAGGKNVAQMLEDPLSAYLVYDFEPKMDSVHGAAMASALKSAKSVYMGAFVTDEIRAFADVILPLAVAPEVDGSLTNLDGTTQTFKAAGAAPGDARAGWKVLRVLANVLQLEGFDFTQAAQVRAAIADNQTMPAPIDSRADDLAPNGEFEWLPSFPVYAADGLVRRSLPLFRSELAKKAAVRFSHADADRLGIDGKASVGCGDLSMSALGSKRLAPGCIIAPMGVVDLDLRFTPHVGPAYGEEASDV